MIDIQSWVLEWQGTIDFILEVSTLPSVWIEFSCGSFMCAAISRRQAKHVSCSCNAEWWWCIASNLKNLVFILKGIWVILYLKHVQQMKSVLHYLRLDKWHFTLLFISSSLSLMFVIVSVMLIKRVSIRCLSIHLLDIRFPQWAKKKTRIEKERKWHS